MEYPSELIEKTVTELSRLPGIGKRSALRIALYLLNQPKPTTMNIASAMVDMRENIKLCSQCYSLSDTEICSICSQPKRHRSVVCVVESIRDVMAIENTNQYMGLYHVLGGIISPLEGIGANDIRIRELVERIENGGVEEVVLALPTTIEGDTTGYYINKIISPYIDNISQIARGVAIGDNIEFTDEITLGRSILNRVPFG